MDLHRLRHVVGVGGVVAIAIVVAPVGAGDPQGDGEVIFGRDVRPILADRCFKCHGPDERAREITGDVRLDIFEGATSDLGGYRAISPGDPGASEMLRRLRSHDPREKMPPVDSTLSVTDDEIATIERWISQGAGYDEHWAYVAPVRPPAPVVSDAGWCRGEIDRFVMARLDAIGSEPSPEADRETLIRRVSFDLTGLPPAPEDIDRFLADGSPAAYERVVDGLLASPAFGERAAMMWLDVARYADTHGYHHDNYRTQYPWRDWVINAFNENLSYDRFVIEQIAGDLLPDATESQIVATGFNRNHPITDEGGAIPEEYLAEYASDRVETMSTTFMSLTMGCTRCHDHKYDPLTMEDYYSLLAFFNSVKEDGVPNNEEGKRNNAFPPYRRVASASQREQLDKLRALVGEFRAEMSRPIEGLDESLEEFGASMRRGFGVSWADGGGLEFVSAASENGATLTRLDDGSVLASGENPDKDVHRLAYRSDETGLRLLRLEVLNHESMAGGSTGRAGNGNSVLTGIEVTVRSLADPEVSEDVGFAWAWADFEQKNGDYHIHNALEPGNDMGWALGGQYEPDARTAMFVADESFGFEGGSEIEVRLRFESIYGQHAFGRVRLSAARASDGVAAAFPTVVRDWYLADSFPGESAQVVFDTPSGPESLTDLDLTARFGNVSLQHRPAFVDGESHPLSGEVRAFYLGRAIFSPVARRMPVSLGSDDAIKVFLNGSEVHSNFTRRGVGPDQEIVTLDLPAGESVLVLKVVNDAGAAGFYFDRRRDESTPWATAPFALVDGLLLTEREREALRHEFMRTSSPLYAARVEHLANAEAKLAEAESAIPNTMVMEELPEARPTYVLRRGAYDHPDEARPVGRRVPPALGSMPDDAPRNRLGLGQWLVSDSNPLVARVAVNRLWQMVFGMGIVKTSENFGMQSEWPSHPALLDWLAVEFRESGWDTKGMLREIVTSSTYRQSSAARPDLAEIDPDNRLLARYPRRRMQAETIRDGALAASGLLVRTVGGASVRPYQPGGLWRERAMLSSDTRIFERDSGEDLYRRGMYTFWKRSAPPPQMAAFDAPEREYCVARRGSTNTPLQALVLLNDETYIEIARALAQRVMREVAGGDDGVPTSRIVRAFRLVTGRRPEADEVSVLVGVFDDTKRRYDASEDEARMLLEYGESDVDETLDASELAAMTVTVSVILNLDESMTVD